MSLVGIEESRMRIAMHFLSRGALKDALNQTAEPMSLEEAYATAIINDALDTDDDENEEASASGSTPPSPKAEDKKDL